MPNGSDAAPEITVGQNRPDHAGRHYQEVLRDLHDWLRPRSYLEIGTQGGATFALSGSPSIAIDPRFQLGGGAAIGTKPVAHFFQMESDRFFADHSPRAILGRSIDLAFLDGMHRCEFLLRDFMHVEPFCRSNSVVVLHDCLPVDDAMADRVEERVRPTAPERNFWWTGDVWRTALALKRFRPDLAITAVDAAPTGLVLITRLDPASTAIRDEYAEIVAAMMSWTLNLDTFFEEMEVRSTAILDAPDKLTALFWM